jgi:8-amino-7-oxononanoate synthase
MSTTADSILLPALQQRLAEQRYRRRRTLQTAQTPLQRLDGRERVAFCSNDYLGLATHPQVVAAFQKAASVYGVGSGASHLVNGHSAEHQALEEELAAFCGRQRALLFSTGYMANMGVISALVGRGDAVFEDRLNHASLLDGGLLSGARFQRFAHNDVAQLNARLERTGAQRKLVVVDGVFSMDGDLAPLDQLAASCQAQQAWLMVDDAHGFGCLGERGAGVVEHFGLGVNDVPVLMATLGKAIGTAGAFVAGSETLIETLIQFSRPYIYTTAMPPAVAAATRASLKLLQTESWRREHLNTLIQHFRATADRFGLTLEPSMTAIQPVILGDEARALAVSAALEARGFLVIAIRPPTVPVGGSRLRITLSSAHTFEQVDALLAALAEVLHESPASE